MDNQVKRWGTQESRDLRIRALHREAGALWPRIEKIIDELKGLGPDSADGDNALVNVRQWLRDLSKR